MSSSKPFEPTLSDVLVVRAMLARTVILPELVGTILDCAEYWARSSTKAQLNQVIPARCIGPGEFDWEGFRFLVSSVYSEADQDATNTATASILPCRPDGACL
ncbi:uncharacterized protein TrAFT101_007922 [Trichoderma asperellum]|uniref:uncharacterized protein n=1 Tax=Trichoderma asperellum TaxID=101201 RepID=UPI0033328157|nr:hypothetical protein TrAFT101_007922 [Trichoderma asperellum]